MRPLASSDHTTWFQDHVIELVECVFPDINGSPRGKVAQAANFAANAELRIARAILSQNITGEYIDDERLSPESDPDVSLRPDHNTLHVVTWSQPPRAIAIHDCLDADGALCNHAPRTVLQRVLERYARLGLTPIVAPEIEFYVTEPCLDPQASPQPPQSGARLREAGYSAFSTHDLDAFSGFWSQLFQSFKELGIQADTWIHEMGMRQFEINLVHGNALQLADQAFLFKYATREIALKHGLNAVFMAKPFVDQAGSSMHIHQSVVNGSGKNAFANPDGSDSKLFRHYLAGLQKYLPELMLFFAPFDNSFRRYIRGSQAPTDLRVGIDDRSAGLRVPRAAPAGRRVENRLAGADANPYLVIAASLAAGLAGIEEELESPANATPLPVDFKEAHQRLQASQIARDLLGDEFIDLFLAAKQGEHDSFQRQITPWERRFLLPQV